MSVSKITGKYFTANDREINTNCREGGKRLFGRADKNSGVFFSVVTICYNNMPSLTRVVDSVLAQSHRDFEYILVDGGSNDGSLEYLDSKSSELDYFISEPDEGIYDAINKGISFCKGDYIILIHADDILKADALYNAYKHLEIAKSDILFGDSIYIDKLFPVAFKPGRHYGEETILRGIAGPHEAAFVSSKTYDEIGGYDSTFDIAADHKFFRNCILKGKVINNIGKVVNYKEVGGDSFDKEKEFEENKRLLSEIFSSIDDGVCKELYSLKNYQKLSQQKLTSLYSMLDKTNLPATFYRVLSKTMVRINLGDSPNEASFGDNDLKAEKIIKSAIDSETIVLAIGKVKGISGGAERVLIELANELHKQGDKVTVVCADGKAGNTFYKLAKGIELLDLNEEPIKSFLDKSTDYQLVTELSQVIDKTPKEMMMIAAANIDIRASAASWNDFVNKYNTSNIFDKERIAEQLKSEIPLWLKSYGGNVSRWRSLLKLSKPKIVIPFMISCIQQVFLANRAHGVPLLLSNHNNPSRDYMTQDEWCPLGLDRMLRLYAVSSSKNALWLLKEYIDYLPPVCRKNAMVLENPISKATILPTYDARDNLLLAIGRYTKVKNFSFLIQVVIKLKRELKGWRLEIYGDGPERENLEKLVADNGLQDMVFLKSPTSNINEVYRRASVFLSSSTVEGFPLTLCEAMAHGVPSIGRGACSGVNSLVKDGYNGLLVDSTENYDLEIEPYSALLISLLRDKEKRVVMSKNAVTSMADYAPEIIYKKWSMAIDKALN
jgi:glycosyltransferase involved in cell wall biosynthesis